VGAGTSGLSEEELAYPTAEFSDIAAELGAADALRRDATEGAFDPYELLGAVGERAVDVGRGLHDGVLSTYMAYCLIGLLVLLAALLAPLVGLW
jgi:hypothetical protein